MATGAVRPGQITSRPKGSSPFGRIKAVQDRRARIAPPRDRFRRSIALRQRPCCEDYPHRIGDHEPTIGPAKKGRTCRACLHPAHLHRAEHPSTSQKSAPAQRRGPSELAWMPTCAKQTSFHACENTICAEQVAIPASVDAHLCEADQLSRMRKHDLRRAGSHPRVRRCPPDRNTTSRPRDRMGTCVAQVCFDVSGIATCFAQVLIDVSGIAHHFCGIVVSRRIVDSIQTMLCSRNCEP
jgi:hypothetical protein